MENCTNSQNYRNMSRGSASTKKYVTYEHTQIQCRRISNLFLLFLGFLCWDRHVPVPEDLTENQTVQRASQHEL